MTDKEFKEWIKQVEKRLKDIEDIVFQECDNDVDCWGENDDE